MQIFTHWTGSFPRGAVAAIGNFDGVHLGHRAVIEAARAQAAACNAPLAVVTFEPHPRAYFAPDAPPFRLMNPEARANRLAKLGIDLLFELPFDAHLAGLSAGQFVHEVLAGGLGLSHVVVGADFRFGKGRGGDVALLEELGPGLGFSAQAVALLSAEEGEPVSSTAIRAALSAGAPREAARMLGHWHRIEGEVAHGDARGRELGYPTANLSLAGLHQPRFGIYAALVDVLSGPHKGSYQGAASLGIRPMFGENRPSFEVHLFDFSGDLYGTHISAALVAFLRDEARFESVEALIAQMDADCAQARTLLGAL